MSREQDYIDEGATTHVKHLGFELELAHWRICNALMWVPVGERAVVIEHLAPVKLKRAVQGSVQGAM